MNTNWSELDEIPLPELHHPDIEMMVRDMIADPKLVVKPITVSKVMADPEDMMILSAWRRAARVLPELREKSIPCSYMMTA
ncbi:MAG: hypothetical protein E6Q36_08870 [Chryseobacterium sp.]|nr:MAG: hypothetical protein E6Q36_08870 [Chryseobacterium sp.]